MHQLLRGLFLGEDTYITRFFPVIEHIYYYITAYVILRAALSSVFEGIELPVVSDGEASIDMGSSTAKYNPPKIGRKLVAAGYCMYSSSTILVLTMGDGTCTSSSLI